VDGSSSRRRIGGGGGGGRGRLVQPLHHLPRLDIVAAQLLAPWTVTRAAHPPSGASRRIAHHRLLEFKSPSAA
jgi:hypothetical protein